MQREQEYKKLVDCMNDTVFVIDFNGKFLEVNDTAVEVLGYSREALLSMGPDDIDPLNDAEGIARLIELMKTGEYYQLELTKIAKKGGDLYKYIKVRNAGGDTFPIGVGAGGNIGNVGVFRMGKGTSFYSVKTDEHRKFDMVSGLMQFPQVNKSDLAKILTEDEMKIYSEKMKDYMTLGYMTDTGDAFALTKEGIFWGNNISKDVLTHLAKVLYGER